MSVVCSLLFIAFAAARGEIIEHRISTCNLEFYSILSATHLFGRGIAFLSLALLILSTNAHAHRVLLWHIMVVTTSVMVTCTLHAFFGTVLDFLYAFTFVALQFYFFSERALSLLVY